VKVVSTLDFTLPPRPGILMLICIPPFLPLPLAGAAAFLSPPFSLPGLSISTILVGNSPISLTRPMASF